MSNEKSPVFMTFYNFKGGIGKTTACWNLAYLLALKGLKVLLIDADTQANLTRRFLTSNAFIQARNLEPEEGENKSTTEKAKEEVKRIEAELLAADNRKRSGLSSLKTFHQCFKDINEEPMDMRDTEIVDLIPSQLSQNLFLLPGTNTSNSALEGYIHNAFTFSTGANIQGARSTPGKLWVPGNLVNFLRRLASENEFDIVMIDMNPNFSAVNRTLIAACHYFMMPVHPESGSEQSIDGLSHQLREWDNSLREFRNTSKVDELKETLAAMEANPTTRKALIERKKEDIEKQEAWIIPARPPQYLGLIVQKYAIMNQKPTSGAQEWIDETTQSLQELFKIFENLHMMSEYGFLTSTSSQLEEYSIEDFRRVGEKLQHLGFPVVSIGNKQHRKMIDECQDISGLSQAIQSEWEKWIVS